MKTTHWFSELAAKLEIINISPRFVARFEILAKEFFGQRMLGKATLNFSTGRK
jgi:hypothetical protein